MSNSSDSSDLDKLAARYLDLWQHQLSGCSLDDKMIEDMQKLIGQMNASSMAFVTALQSALENAPVQKTDVSLSDQATNTPVSPNHHDKASGIKESSKEKYHDDQTGNRNLKRPNVESGTSAPDLAPGFTESPLDRLSVRIAALEKRVTALEKRPPAKRTRTSGKS